MDPAKRIEAVIQPTLTDMGFEIVRVMIQGSQRPRLQIMAEHIDGSAIDVEDCATISRSVSTVLDVEDLIKDAFVLEVSSPGIDRPLTRLKDFTTWAGFDARVELRTGIEGRKRFNGRLMGVNPQDTLNGAMILLEDETGTAYALPFDDIQRAKLLLSDELIAATTTEQTK